LPGAVRFSDAGRAPVSLAGDVDVFSELAPDEGNEYCNVPRRVPDVASGTSGTACLSSLGFTGDVKPRSCGSDTVALVASAIGGAARPTESAVAGTGRRHAENTAAVTAAAGKRPQKPRLRTKQLRAGLTEATFSCRGSPWQTLPIFIEATLSREPSAAWPPNLDSSNVLLCAQQEIGHK